LGYIYKIKNIISNKTYIGQTVKKDVRRRWSEHLCLLRSDNHYNSHLQNSFNKHGEEFFIFGVVKQHDTIEELNESETFFIEKFESLTPNGYNLTTGGQNTILSQEIIEKLSGENNHNYGLKGKDHYLYGIERTDEVKEKVRQKVLLAYKEDRLNVTGANNPFYGKKHTEKTKKKISNSRTGKRVSGNHPNAKKVIQYDLNGEEIKEWDCIIDAGKEIGINRRNISAVCNGKRKTCGGYKWKYKEL